MLQFFSSKIANFSQKDIPYTCPFNETIPLFQIPIVQFLLPSIFFLFFLDDPSFPYLSHRLIIANVVFRSKMASVEYKCKISTYIYIFSHISSHILYIFSIYISVKYYIRSLLVEFRSCVASSSLFSMFCGQDICIKS